MPFTRYDVAMDSDSMIALHEAIDMGAFAERQATLRALIQSNRGNQMADTYERELRALERGVSTIREARAAK